MRPKTKKILKVTTLSLTILVILLCLFVVAFVFNPLEGSLPDMRDVVPREVDFFVRKIDLDEDFDAFPEPWFWEEFADGRAWEELQRGRLISGMRGDLDRALEQVREALAAFDEQSAGLLDPMRDLMGTEVIVAGMNEDRTGPAPRPLAEPWWCLYARVSWRVRFAWGVAQWGVVQDMARDAGAGLSNEGPVLVVELRGRPDPLYAARVRDCLMVANNKQIIEQSLRLAEGSPDEEPFGKAAKYTDGVSQRISDWEQRTAPEVVNALEFSVKPNRIDGFDRFAKSWPNANAEDSMNERVMAAFVNLTGWNSVSGAVLFEPPTFRIDDYSDFLAPSVSVLGEVVLNSHNHTPFQSRFFQAEAQPRSGWLDPFLRMVPSDACAAAALRMPAGDFIDEMFDALSRDEKELFNDSIRRTGQYTDARDLIEKIRSSLLPRTGFVFRKNVPDTSRDPETGDLQVPVAAISPVPQIAWVFWIRDGLGAPLNQFVDLLKQYSQTFKFQHVYNLQMGQDAVTEFTNPQIPGTGEIATIIFRDFFVLSNSGPLVKDMFHARYGKEGRKSILENPDMQRFDQEIPPSLNGFLYLNGGQMVRVLEDYRQFIDKLSQDVDPSWMVMNRQAGEEYVRKSRYPTYLTVAGIPEHLRAEFNDAVTKHLTSEWQRRQSEMTPDDLATIEQLKAFSEVISGAYLQLDLENNYLRFTGRLLLDYR